MDDSQANNINMLFSDESLFWRNATNDGMDKRTINHSLMQNANSNITDGDYAIAPPATMVPATTAAATCSATANINDIFLFGQQQQQQQQQQSIVNNHLHSTLTAQSSLMTTTSNSYLPQMSDNSLNDFDFLDLLSQQQKQQSYPSSSITHFPSVATSKNQYMFPPKDANTAINSAELSLHHLQSRYALIGNSIDQQCLTGTNIPMPPTATQQQYATYNTKRKGTSIADTIQSTNDIVHKVKPKKRKRKKAINTTGTTRNVIDENGVITVDNSVQSTAPKTKKNTGLNKPLLLSPLLSTLMGGEKQLPRPEIVKRLWNYIKTNQLQDPADRRFILCDEKLKQLFQKDRVNSFGMNKDLTVHLTSIESKSNKEVTMITPSDILMRNTTSTNNNVDTTIATSPVQTADNTPDIMTPKDTEYTYKWNY